MTMTLFADRSIRTKLTFTILFISGISVVLVSGGLLAYEFTVYRDLLVQDLKTKADIIAENINAAIAFRDSSDAARVLQSLSSQPNIHEAAAYDDNGSLFAAYQRSDIAGTIPAKADSLGWRFEGGLLLLSRPVHLGESQIGSVSMTSDLSMLNQLLWSYAQITVGILAGAFVIALIVTSALARTITRPIMSLADAARLVSEHGDYSLRAQVPGKDETGVLANSMNQMLEQIQEREAREHQAREEIRKLNEELEERVKIRTTQLEAANKELEAFSYSISHDLRAPLRHIDGFTQLLQKDLAGKLDSNARRLLDVISTSAKTLGEMIDNLLTFSKMGKTELRKQTLDMSALVLEVLREIENESRSARVEMAAAPIPPVAGDRAMLKLVWTNLLLNAFKYSRTRPTPSVEIGWRSEGHEHLFYVRDNGVGFDMRYVGKLFGVFERLHAADEFEGTGIGLANVKRIILRHEGRVWAEGAVDRGATFYFTLPHLP